MGEFSIFHWLVVLAVILIFFGGKRIPEIMKGFGEGIRSFKDGMAGTPQKPPPPAQAPAPPPLDKPVAEKKKSPAAQKFSRYGRRGRPCRPPFFFLFGSLTP